MSCHSCVQCHVIPASSVMPPLCVVTSMSYVTQDVSCNELTHLPVQIGGVRSLRRLNMRCNRLVELPEGRRDCHGGRDCNCRDCCDRGHHGGRDRNRHDCCDCDHHSCHDHGCHDASNCDFHDGHGNHDCHDGDDRDHHRRLL